MLYRPSFPAAASMIRRHTIFFAGKGSSGVRVTMQRLFEHHPDFYFPHDMTHRYGEILSPLSRTILLI